MSANIEQMAYISANGVPWHGLGHEITPSMSIDEMIEAGGLNWGVKAVKMYSRSIVEPYPVEEIVGYRRITRDSDNKTFMIASDRYTPDQPREIVEFFQEYMESASLQLDTLGSLNGGATIWAMGKLGKDFTLPGEDRTYGNLMVATSFDGSLPYVVKGCNTRVVCMNTLGMALGEKGNEFRAKHSRKDRKSVAADAKKALGIATTRFAQNQEQAEFLTTVKVDPKGQEVYRYVAALADPELLEKITAATTINTNPATGGSLLDSIVSTEILKPKKITESDFNRAGRGILEAIITSPGSDLASAKDTMWGVLNGVTYWADHTRGDSRTSQDSRLNNAWFGQVSKLKTNAVDLAMVMAQTIAGQKVN
jgi:phage/plasmid-like protein (TIGR03299 family)